MQILVVTTDNKQRDAMAIHLMKFLERVCDCPIEFKYVDEHMSELEASGHFMDIHEVITIEGRSI